MKLIDKDALAAEIEKIFADETESIKSFEHGKNVSEVSRSNARIGILMHIRSLLDTIEGKEVDLETEIDDVWNPHFNLGWDDNSLVSINHKSFESIAHHFFELGLNASEEA